VANLEAGARLRVVTQGMAYGPHAVARVDGLVVFVRGAAVDEEVEVEVRERRRSHAFADVVAVTRPSPRRVAPPCAYLPHCGGCPWQQLDYAAQLEAKGALVGEQLRRLAGIDVSVPAAIASPRVFGYRRRIKLRVADRRVGFYAGATHDLVAVRHCLLAESGVDAAIPAAAALARALSSPLRRIEIIAVRPGGREVVLAGEIEGEWRDDDRVGERWLQESSARRGLVLRGRRWSRVWGDTTVWSEAEPGLELSLAAPGFTQVNAKANLALVKTALAFAAPQPGERILDLYAGAGNFTAPLARRGAAVIAVEHAETALASAANARRLGDRWQVRRGWVEREVEALAERGERFATVLLDPPRSGAAPVVPSLLRIGAPRVVYVSCDPATLARDVKSLRGTYQVRAVQPIDMFPHSYHVETVVLLEKRAPRG
jgi:23S rRNA (uracil1939-C5)-methyltransferase